MSISELLVGVLIFAPIIFLLFFSAWNLYKYSQVTKNDPVRKKLAADLLGPFSVFFPKLESQEARRYMSRVQICFVLALAYLLTLMWLFPAQK